MGGNPQDGGGKQQGIYMGHSSIYGHGYLIQNLPLGQPQVPHIPLLQGMLILEYPWAVKDERKWILGQNSENYQNRKKKDSKNLIVKDLYGKIDHNKN